MKPSRVDRGGAVNDPGRHMHLEAGVARGARHRQAVGEEIPVLGDDIEQAQRVAPRPDLRRPLGRAGAQQIVQMHDADRPAGFDDEQRGDLR